MSEGIRVPERVRRVARCSWCERIADGVTTRQQHLREWGQRARDFHVCDDCAASVVERPLDAVLGEYVEAARP